MKEHETANTIRQLLKQIPGADHSAIASLKDNDSLFDLGILDSLGLIELISQIESHFSITLAEESLVPSNFESLAKIVSFLTKAKAAA